MAKAKFEQTNPAAALTGVGVAQTDDKTGAADAAQTGTVLPATGTAGATADAAGANTLAADVADAADLVEPATMVGSEYVTVIVQGPPAGRWRIGRHFTAEPVSIVAIELTFEQMAALKADPLLMISVVETPY
jgi:hypothetical protein